VQLTQFSTVSDKLAYTWSHEIDDGQSLGQSTSNLFLSNNSNWLYNGNYEADRGDGNEGQRQRFVVDWVWEHAFSRRTGGFVNNWQLFSITTIGIERHNSPTIRVTDAPVPGHAPAAFTINGSGLSTRSCRSIVCTNQRWTSRNARICKIIPVNKRYRPYLNF